MDIRYHKGTAYDSRSGMFSSSQKREMHKATCHSCKKDCEVPFKPTEGKKVYCKECYRDMSY